MSLCDDAQQIPQPVQSLDKRAAVWVNAAEQTSATCSPGGKFLRGGFLILLPRELMYDELPADFNCDSINKRENIYIFAHNTATDPPLLGAT